MTSELRLSLTLRLLGRAEYSASFAERFDYHAMSDIFYDEVPRHARGRASELATSLFFIYDKAMYDSQSKRARQPPHWRIKRRGLRGLDMIDLSH